MRLFNLSNIALFVIIGILLSCGDVFSISGPSIGIPQIQLNCTYLDGSEVEGLFITLIFDYKNSPGYDSCTLKFGVE